MFVLLESGATVFLSYGAIQTWVRRFTPQRTADWLLAWSAIIIPASNLASHYSGALKGFILNKSFLAYHSWMSFAAAVLMPPAHGLVHWTMASPAFV